MDSWLDREVLVYRPQTRRRPARIAQIAHTLRGGEIFVDNSCCRIIGLQSYTQQHTSDTTADYVCLELFVRR